MQKVVIKVNTKIANSNKLSKVNIVNNNNLEKRISHITFFTLGFLALCYVILLGNMVFNIVERKTLEADARNISNEVGDLELQYLALSNKVDMKLAYSMGFGESKDKQFATRKSLGSLKLANNDL